MNGKRIQPGWQIEFYTNRRGRSPVLDFINGLPVRERAAVRNVLRLLREFGTLLRLPHARPLRDKVWELRPRNIRLLYFAHTDRRLIVLHGFRKKSNKTPAREISIAIRRMNEFLENEE